MAGSGAGVAAAAAAALQQQHVDPNREASEALYLRWPGRKQEIKQLLGLLGAPHDHAMPIFVHGPPVTGKSSIVRDVFAALGRPFAYTSLVDSHGPRLLLDAIVEELAPHLRGLSAKQMRCDRLADLVAMLADGLPRDGPSIYLVIDEATRLLDWKGAEPLLPALMKLSELTGESSSPSSSHIVFCGGGVGGRGRDTRHPHSPFFFF